MRYNFGIGSLGWGTLFGVAGATTLTSLPCEGRLVFLDIFPIALLAQWSGRRPKLGRSSSLADGKYPVTCRALFAYHL